jgi:hypothetical protein
MTRGRFERLLPTFQPEEPMRLTLNERLVTAENLANALSRAGRPNRDAQAHLNRARRAIQIQVILDVAKQELDAALELFGDIMRGSASPEERERANAALDKIRKQHRAVENRLAKNGSLIDNIAAAEQLLKIKVAV